MVEWFQSNAQLLSYLGTWLAALFTFIIVLITWRANATIQQLAKYANKQKDRDKIEKILNKQIDAGSAFSKSGDFDDLDVMRTLVQAREQADLYQLYSLKEYLENCTDVYKKGYILRSNLWDENGIPKSYENHKRDMDKYHALIRQAYQLYFDYDVYKLYLKVELLK